MLGVQVVCRRGRHVLTVGTGARRFRSATRAWGEVPAKLERVELLGLGHECIEPNPADPMGSSGVAEQRPVRGWERHLNSVLGVVWCVWH